MKTDHKNHSMATVRCGPGARTARGFTLVEILLAIFILGIGLIMVATIFPIATDWTRQNVEESLAGVIAENARAIIVAKYNYSDLSSVTSTVQAFPGISDSGGSKLPLTERAYAFGQSPPYPAAAPANALYFWTALVRKDPDPVSFPATRQRFDLYICVFKKGDVNQQYSSAGIGRDPSETEVPCMVIGSVGSVPIGSIAIGQGTGTEYRILQGGTSVVPLVDGSLIYAPGADATVGTANSSNTAASPLVYVYQTKVDF